MTNAGRLHRSYTPDTKKGTRSKVKWRAVRTISRGNESVSKVLPLEDDSLQFLPGIEQKSRGRCRFDFSAMPQGKSFEFCGVASILRTKFFNFLKLKLERWNDGIFCEFGIMDYWKWRWLRNVCMNNKRISFECFRIIDDGFDRLRIWMGNKI